MLGMSAPAPEPVFRARGLTKVYRTGEVEVHALRGVDLDIYRGEFIVLLGASGSGKSTLLNIIGGLVRGELGAQAAPFSGSGLLLATAWLVRHDVATRTIRLSQQPRFSAACLLAGYFWLGAAGLLLLVVPPSSTAFSYDAAVHAVTIGFVLSMIFGHAPIILPAVVGLRVQYSAAAYVPLALLHLSVLLRITADLFDWVEISTFTGPLTIIALACYAAILVTLHRRSKSESGHRRA